MRFIRYFVCSVLYILLGVNVSQVLIGYVNTTSTQVFVYVEGHSNGTVFPGECIACYPTVQSCVSLQTAHRNLRIERYSLGLID